MNPEPTTRLLLVCDADAVTRHIQRLLAISGHSTLVVANAEEALEQMRSSHWDAVLCWTGMDVRPGISFAAQAQAEDMHTSLVLLAEKTNVEDAVLAMRSGCANYLCMKGVEKTLHAAVLQAAQRSFTQRAVAEQRTRERSALQLAESRVRFMEAQARSMEETVVSALLSALEVREPDTRAHSMRLRAYATHLAKLVNHPATLIPHLQNACVLHDIGKLEIPFHLLNQPGVLPACQLEALRPHATFGERILNESTFLRSASLLVRHHHERWDGSGYPDGLTGENIPQGSRILSIADALDAITTEQSYRPAQSFSDAVNEICRWSGRQFDPVLIRAFRAVPAKKWSELRDAIRESLKVEIAEEKQGTVSAA